MSLPHRIAEAEEHLKTLVENNGDALYSEELGELNDEELEELSDILKQTSN